MNFSLPSAMESFIRKQVKSGRYGNASEVVREGLRLLMHEIAARQKKLEALRHEIRKGIDSGLSKALDIDEIIAEARRRREVQKGLASGEPIEEGVVFERLKRARAKRLKVRNATR